MSTREKQPSVEQCACSEFASVEQTDYCSTGVALMTLQINLEQLQARVRIAVPAWNFTQRIPVSEVKRSPGVDDFKRLLDAALQPKDLTPLRLTRDERRQLDISRRLRVALYDSRERTRSST